MADALRHLSAEDRHKLQRYLNENECGSMLITGPLQQLCRLCSRPLLKPYTDGRPPSSFLIWFQKTEKCLTVCTNRECLLRAAQLFHEYRVLMEREG